MRFGFFSAGHIFGIAVVLLIGGLIWYASAESSYQADADIIRLNDVAHLGQLIERYQERTGHYPFEGKYKVPVYVHIATEEQKRQIIDGPPHEHVVLDASLLRDELENALGQRIELPTDPQRVAVGRPNFYMYMIDGDTYYAAVHLHGDFPFTQTVGPNYHKLEVSNRPNPNGGIWALSDLLQNSRFLFEATLPLEKPHSSARSNFRDALETAKN
jgi:hypothetical protein